MEVYGQHRDLEQVRALLGHTRIETTQIYAQIQPAQAERVGEVLRGASARRADELAARKRTTCLNNFSKLLKHGVVKHQRNQNGGPNGIRTRV